MDAFPDFKVYADQLAVIARWAHGKGWAPATSTNYSVRLPDQAAPALCVITSSGVDKEWICADQMLAVDSAGEPVGASSLKPSAETLLHTMLYRTVEAGAVLHTHSLAAAVLSRVAGKHRRLVFSGWEILKGLNGVETHDAKVVLPVFPNSQDVRALAASIEPCLRQERPLYGFLLEGHGLYAWGRDLTEAKRHLEVYEFVLQCEREVRLYGDASGS